MQGIRWRWRRCKRGWAGHRDPDWQRDPDCDQRDSHRQGRQEDDLRHQPPGVGHPRPWRPYHHCSSNFVCCILQQTMSQRLFIFLQSCVKTTTYLHQLKEVSTLREEVADAAVSQEKKNRSMKNPRWANSPGSRMSRDLTSYLWMTSLNFKYLSPSLHCILHQ